MNFLLKISILFLIGTITMDCASGPSSKHPDTIEKRDYRIKEFVDFYESTIKPKYMGGKWKSTNKTYTIGQLESQIAAIGRLTKEKSRHREVLVDDLSQVNIKTSDFDISLSAYQDKLRNLVSEIKGGGISMCLKRDYKIQETLSGGKWKRTAFFLFAKERERECDNYANIAGFQDVKKMKDLRPYLSELRKACKDEMYTRGWIDEAQVPQKIRTIIINCQEKR